ncbi:MAG TPA: AarF/ABC1/UbiB kinase family protein [Pyrinomonadaceae bacterium]|jgi:predicted unusual protein kinase regulating ubiquinone biosynthesis (AarF/ABC1/UbiB family)|nr:AarF/ABC1/UbiB kinase family protein [Pyrinomonadaceae bacterium]
MSPEKNTPTRRALAVASMGAGIAGSYLGYVLQRAFLGDAQSEAKLKSAHASAARRMRNEMQALRGPAMKLGQMLSLQTGILPDEVLAELASLQMEAPGMHPSLVRVQIKQGLGGEPEDIFKEFTPEPFAAASLGQVHRAVTREGEHVAVKVQYPGIRQAITNDFKLFRAVSKPAQASGHIPKAAIDEMEQQIIAETDYRREAENIEFFGKQLTPLAFVHIPRVLRAYSSDKVLTMSLMRGQHLEDFLARRPSQKLRDQLGANLCELFFFQVLKVEALHADPHWGNYLFLPDGGVWLVDFGCAKYLSPETVAYLRSVFLYPGATDSADFQRLLEKPYRLTGQKLHPATRRALVSFAENFYRKVYSPWPEKRQPFDFADKGFLEDYLRESKNLLRTKGVMIEYIFMARAEMGLYHTLHRLKARVPTSDIVRKYL